MRLIIRDKFGGTFMKAKLKTWWDNLKTFDWNIFIALCLLALVPFPN